MFKTYSDFKKNGIIFTEKYIVVPSFGRAKINKLAFMTKTGKYDLKKQERYLKKFYNKYYGK